MYKIVVEILEGGYFSGPKMEILGRRGDLQSEIPSVVGVWIFSGTTQYMGKVSQSKTMSCTTIKLMKSELDEVLLLDQYQSLN